MHELNGELDLCILVGWRFGRRIGFGATSPYASPVPVTNLQGAGAHVSGAARLPCETTIRTSSMNWSLSAKV